MRDIRSNGGVSKNKRQRLWASRTWRKIVVSRLQIAYKRSGHSHEDQRSEKSKSVHRVSECSQSHDFGRENERRNHFTCHVMTWLLMMMTTSDFPVWNHWFLILYFLYFFKILLVSQPFLSPPQQIDVIFYRRLRKKGEWNPYSIWSKVPGPPRDLGREGDFWERERGL